MTPERAPLLTPELVRDVVTDSLCAVVVYVDTAGRVSRRSFLTLAAAERAVDRARARGGQAAVVLVELHPVATAAPARGASNCGRHEVFLGPDGRYRPNLRAEGVTP